MYPTAIMTLQKTDEVSMKINGAVQMMNAALHTLSVLCQSLDRKCTGLSAKTRQQIRHVVGQSDTAQEKRNQETGESSCKARHLAYQCNRGIDNCKTNLHGNPDKQDGIALTCSCPE